MDSHEEIIVIAGRATPQVFFAGVDWTVWDLIFTNRRVIAIKTGRVSPLKTFLLGTFYVVYEDRRSRQRSKAIRDAPVSDILGPGEEKEFFEYRELESITLRLRHILSSEIQLKRRGERRKRFFLNRRAAKAVLDASVTLRLHGAPMR
jgi:hypothetical protein